MAFLMDTKKANRLIRQFEASCYDKAFKGAQHPEDHAVIEKNYSKARGALLKALTEDQPIPAAVKKLLKGF